MPERVGFFAPLRAQPKLLPLLILVTLMMSGNGLVAPILSLYARTFSVGSTMVGMIITMFGVGRLIANTPAGIFTQKFGPKPLLCGGPILVAIGSVGAALATSLEMLLFWRLVQGFGSGIYMTVSTVTIVSTVSAGERGRVMSLYQGALLLGTGTGPAIGGWLASWFGFTAPFWAFAGVALAALLVAWRGVEPAAGAVQKQRQGGQSSIAPLLTDSAFMVLCLVNFGVFFTRTASQFQLIPLIAHGTFGLDVASIGLGLTLTSVGNFAMLPFTGNLIDRYGARPVLISSTLASGSALLLIALAPNVPLFMGGLALLGIAGGLNGPSAVAQVTSLVAVDRFGPAIGLQRTFGDAGFVIGPIIVGLLDDFGSVGYTGGVLFNAGLVLFGGSAFWLVGRWRLQSKP